MFLLQPAPLYTAWVSTPGVDPISITVKLQGATEVILYEADMITCLRVLSAGYIPIKSELLHEMDARGVPGTPEF